LDSISVSPVGLLAVVFATNGIKALLCVSKAYTGCIAGLTVRAFTTFALTRSGSGRLLNTEPISITILAFAAEGIFTAAWAQLRDA